MITRHDIIVQKVHHHTVGDVQDLLFAELIIHGQKTLVNR